jgi:hypothetical protein
MAIEEEDTCISSAILERRDRPTLRGPWAMSWSTPLGPNNKRTTHIKYTRVKQGRRI